MLFKTQRKDHSYARRSAYAQPPAVCFFPRLFTNRRPNCLCAMSWTGARSIKMRRRFRATTISENLINSEAEILTSWDFSYQVAEADWQSNVLAPTWTPGQHLSRVRPRDRYSSGVNGDSCFARRTTLFSCPTETVTRNSPRSFLRTRDALFYKHLEVHRSAEAFNFVTSAKRSGPSASEPNRRRTRSS